MPKPRPFPSGPRKNRRKPVSPQQRAQRVLDMETDKKVLALVRGGATISKVAEELGLKDMTAARTAIIRTFERYAPPENHVTHARRVLVDQLLAMVRVSWAKGVNGEKSDIRWHKETRENLAMLSKVLGTDAPIEHRHGQSAQAPPTQMWVADLGELREMSDDELQSTIELAAKAAQAHIATAAVAAPRVGAGAPPEGGGTDGSGAT